MPPWPRTPTPMPTGRAGAGGGGGATGSGAGRRASVTGSTRSDMASTAAVGKVTDGATPAVSVAVARPAAVLASVDAEMRGLIERLQSPAGAVTTPALRAAAGLNEDERPMHGTTIYIADVPVETRFGLFRAFIFQDIVDKHYLIALVHGDVTVAPPEVLYTRVHSSCVTSETLRGCDCDCVQQLEAAIRVIGSRNGVLFYIMQEGRGVGYVSKSRDRMLVQASRDRLSTFQAYGCMGLRKDHRNYENIADICYMMAIRAPFVVLTNNPDKVAALTRLGLPVSGMDALEVEPSTFNVAYLHAKAISGHVLHQPGKSEVRRVLPPEPVDVCRTTALASAKRFVHAATYYLPVKPVDDDILLSGEEMAAMFAERSIDAYLADSPPVILSYRELRGGRYFVRVDPAEMSRFAAAHPTDPICDLRHLPYWFAANVYFDVATSQDFIVLTHGKVGMYDIPVVRLHSESLFDRFPLRNTVERAKYKGSVKAIVEYGVGALQLLYNDGRGAGFGAMSVERMVGETLHAGSTAAARMVGIEADMRDFNSAVLLLKPHLHPATKVQVVVSTAGSLSKKPDLGAALYAHGLQVADWIFLRVGAHAARGGLEVGRSTRGDDGAGALRAAKAASLATALGHTLIDERLASIPATLRDMVTTAAKPLAPATLAATRFVITGAGSSEAHGRYLAWLVEHYVPGRSASFRHLTSFLHESSSEGGGASDSAGAGRTLIVFSQGLSPNAQLALRAAAGYDHVVLFTGSTAAAERAAGRADRATLLEGMQARGADIITFPLANEYTTLIRVVGPAAGYVAALQFAGALSAGVAPGHPGKAPAFPLLTPAAVDTLTAARVPTALMDAMLTRPDAFADGFYLVSSSPVVDCLHNIAYKFMEGLYWQCPTLCDILDFAHGPFQQLMVKPRPVVVLQSSGAGDKDLVARATTMMRTAGLHAFVVACDAAPVHAILAYESMFNALLAVLMRSLEVDQVHWPGKGADGPLYNYNGAPAAPPAPAAGTGAGAGAK